MVLIILIALIPLLSYTLMKTIKVQFVKLKSLPKDKK
jgi:hypothetical protein